MLLATDGNRRSKSPNIKTFLMRILSKFKLMLIDNMNEQVQVFHRNLSSTINYLEFFLPFIGGCFASVIRIDRNNVHIYIFEFT